MNAPLDSLRDIHLPAPINHWWPLPWGVTAGILIIILCLAVFKGYQRYLQQKLCFKKQALAQLSILEHAYQHQQMHPYAICAAISELLKRTALLYYPRTQVAALTNDNWLMFLTTSAKNLDFAGLYNELCIVPYKNYRNAELPVNVSLLLSNARTWIKQQGHMYV